jgi:hypothetical protein
MKLCKTKVSKKLLLQKTRRQITYQYYRSSHYRNKIPAIKQTSNLRKLQELKHPRSVKNNRKKLQWVSLKLKKQEIIFPQKFAIEHQRR